MDEELVGRMSPPSANGCGPRARKKASASRISPRRRASRSAISKASKPADWDALPAPTYTIGFAKSYASAVGLDRIEIGDQLREEMGGQRFADHRQRSFRAGRSGADDAQMAGARRDCRRHRPHRCDELAQPSLAQPARTNHATPMSRRRRPRPRRSPPPPAPPPRKARSCSPPASRSGCQFNDKGGTLFEGTLAPGQSFTVPANAAAPLLKTGKPEG